MIKASQFVDEIETFHSWAGLGIICPDFKNTSMFSIHNDGLFMSYSTININSDKFNLTKHSFWASD